VDALIINFLNPITIYQFRCDSLSTIFASSVIDISLFNSPSSPVPIMAPSATAEIVAPVSKVEVAAQPEKHVHGAEDKTPLEAISHGPLIQPGMRLVSLASN
jgi:hypothetical protein